MFKSGKLAEARQFLCENLAPNEYDDFYSFMYQNLELFTSDQAKQDEIIITIRDGVYKHAFIADAEINLSATLVQIIRILE
jgi:hypothetical protein